MAAVVVGQLQHPPTTNRQGHLSSPADESRSNDPRAIRAGKDLGPNIENGSPFVKLKIIQRPELTDASPSRCAPATG